METVKKRALYRASIAFFTIRASWCVAARETAAAAVIEQMCFGLNQYNDANIRLRVGHVIGDTPAELSFILPSVCTLNPEECIVLSKQNARPGDVVVVEQNVSGFVCAHGRVGNGWLPVDRVHIEDPQQLDLSISSWVGVWRSVDSEATIAIAAASEKSLRANGDATWQGANGLVRVGYFDATSTPKGSSVSFVESGGAGPDCRVSLILTRNLLAAVDNGNCGGLNVRFAGFFIRKDDK
jgi:hypothetical protein